MNLTDKQLEQAKQHIKKTFFNIHLARKKDVLTSVNENGEFIFIGITGDGFVQLLNCENKKCFIASKGFNQQFKFKNLDEVIERFIKEQYEKAH